MAILTAYHTLRSYMGGTSLDRVLTGSGKTGMSGNVRQFFYVKEAFRRLTGIAAQGGHFLWYENDLKTNF